MNSKIIIAGSGGQGVLLLGKLIAYAAMLSDRYVTWFPSYGAEMRGGTANCTVVISDEDIGSPVVKTPDILVVFNCPSFERFIPRLKRGGQVFYDSSLVSARICSNGRFEESLRNFQVVSVNATTEAVSLGSARFTNMVMFGAFIKKSGLMNHVNTGDLLRKVLPKRHHSHIEKNLEAIERGIGSIEN